MTSIITNTANGYASGGPIEGGKKVATVNVADLFEVYPELVEAYYSAGYAEDSEKRAYEENFSLDLTKAAGYSRGKKAFKALKKINKEDK